MKRAWGIPVMGLSLQLREQLRYCTGFPFNAHAPVGVGPPVSVSNVAKIGDAFVSRQLKSTFRGQKHPDENSVLFAGYWLAFNGLQGV